MGMPGSSMMGGMNGNMGTGMNGMNGGMQMNGSPGPSGPGWYGGTRFDLLLVICKSLTLLYHRLVQLRPTPAIPNNSTHCHPRGTIVTYPQLGAQCREFGTRFGRIRKKLS